MTTMPPNIDFEAMLRAASDRADRGVALCRCGVEVPLPHRSCAPCHERERAEAEQRHREQAVGPTMRTIPPAFEWASFAAPELRERVKPAGAIDVARRSLAAPVVMIIGDSGVGKTSLAVAMLRACAEDRVERGMFVDSRALVRARNEQRLGDGEARLVADAIRARVLVLDELGAECGRGTAESVVAEVIHERHAQQRRTIVTTPFASPELTARYGAGIVRRLAERCAVIRLGAA